MYLSLPKAFVLAGVALSGSSAAMLQQPQQISLGDTVLTESTDQSSHGRGRLIVAPPRPTDTGLKQIPDAAHPYHPPGPNDQRGPCPALNTAANHGYIPRHGIVSYEDLIHGITEAFNMDYSLVGGLASMGLLKRGNAFTNQLSIGGESHLIPTLPDNIDGHAPPGGLSKHGRFEGDMSMSRFDAGAGDHVNFQGPLYDQMLLSVGEFGADSPVTGNRSIVTLEAMGHIRHQRFIADQKQNPHMNISVGRFELSAGEGAFLFNFFANGTDNLLDVLIMSSFLRNQMFPENWHRRSSPATLADLTPDATAILEAAPFLPGANDANGNFVIDPKANVTDICGSIYPNVGVDTIPATLAHVTGIFKQNVDFLLPQVAALFGCPVQPPNGPIGV